jgi:hypothetical protein
MNGISVTMMRGLPLSGSSISRLRAHDDAAAARGVRLADALRPQM